MNTTFLQMLSFVAKPLADGLREIGIDNILFLLAATRLTAREDETD